MEMTWQIWLTIGFLVYALFLQLYDDFTRVSTTTNVKSRIIDALRSEYKVTVRTFRSHEPFGFCSFRAVWINDRVLRSEKQTKHVFHHEHYHLKNKHKLWNLVIRILVSITPLTVYFVHWGIFIGILLLVAYLSQRIKEVFEVKAEKYAYKMTS
jgi:hypothetical protein